MKIIVNPTWQYQNSAKNRLDDYQDMKYRLPLLEMALQNDKNGFDVYLDLLEYQKYNLSLHIVESMLKDISYELNRSLNNEPFYKSIDTLFDKLKEVYTLSE